MGKSRRASETCGHLKGEFGSSGTVDAGAESEGNFVLHATDVWEDDDLGRFAKERWSEGPRRRRSQWLRQQLDLASEGGESELSAFTRIG